jgi:hypothetical protein
MKKTGLEDIEFPIKPHDGCDCWHGKVVGHRIKLQCCECKRYVDPAIPPRGTEA